MSQYSHLSILDPEFAPLVPLIPPNESPLSIEALRASVPVVTAGVKQFYHPRLPAETEFRVEHHMVPVDGGEIRVRCTIPTGSSEQKTFPVLVWYHGGGFAIGDIEMDDYQLKIMSVRLQISVVSVEYRLAPDYSYPVPWDDCYAATKWVIDHTSLLSASLNKGFIVAGGSAGGNLAAYIAQRARDDPVFSRTPITGQYLQCPCLLHPELSPEEYRSELLSMEENKDGPGLTREMMTAFARWCGAPEGYPGYSVLLNPSRTGLAPAYIQVAGTDVLRDEGLLYAKLLKEAGVKTRVDIYPGLPHVFAWYFPHLTASKKLEKDTDEAIKWLLSKP
ncbi:alpha/beta-hydrolase [Sparassis latifolia]